MKKARRGMILPLVIMAMFVVLIVSAGAQLSSWRAARGAQLHWDAERALHAADAATADKIAAWSAQQSANTPIGVELLDSIDDDGWTMRRDVRRTAPLVAVVHTRFERLLGVPAVAAALGDPYRTRRDITRIVRLAPPEFGIAAATTTLGALVVNGAGIDARDLGAQRHHPLDDCGSVRDTASVDAVRAHYIDAIMMSFVQGDIIALPTTAVDAARQRFDRAWDLLQQRVHVATDDARYRDDPVAWRARVMLSASAESLRTNTRMVGVLAIDGDFIVRTALHLDGVLIVRGALDATRAPLDVDGAVIVRDTNARGSHFGSTLTVRYAPCLVGRALATVARPMAAPFASWQGR